MVGEFDLWRMIAGLALFLFAMTQMESALKAIGSRSLARFLKRSTDTPLKAVGGGIVATALLQSSSVVGLMVLAFTAAGLLTLVSALGIVFGSNLGTTFTGWIVATLGFKVDIEAMLLPLVAAGGLLYVFGKGRLARVGQAVVGLGLLLLGLAFMKDSVATLADSIDIAVLANLAAWQYLLFGFVFAAVIQSSSATMIITLAALDVGIIDLPSAAAIAIGADLGTTTTVLLGAIKGSGAKRRVAVAHFIFNFVTDAIAFVFLTPLLFVVATLGISDPLYSLVAFHSLFNLMGLAIFLPVVRPFASWLERQFLRETPAEARYLPDSSPELSSAALEAVELETAYLIARVVRQNMLVFTPPLPRPPGRLPVATSADADSGPSRFDEMYEATKRLEGEILGYATRLQSQPLEAEESERLRQLLAAVRNAVHSTKQLKDIRHNLAEFEEAPGRRVRDYLDHFFSVANSFYTELFVLRRADHTTVLMEDIVELIQQVHEWHEEMHSEIIRGVTSRRVPEEVASSLLNVNRELVNSNLSLLAAITDYHLAPDKAMDLRRLPRIS